MFAVLSTLKNGRCFHNRYINIGYAVVLPHTYTWQREIQYQNLFIFEEQINETLPVKFNEILGFWKHAWMENLREPEKLSESDMQ